MKERYEIESVEQLRAVADLLRIRIIELLEKRAMTVTQLGDELGLAPAKVHYHVRELERVGLLKLVETREKGGILEKYYQPVAHEIGVNKALLSAPHDEAQAMLRGWFTQFADGYLHAFRQVAETQDPAQEGRMGLFLAHLYLTSEEQRQLFNQIEALLKPFEQKREIEDGKEIVFSTFVYPTDATQREQPEEASSAQTSWAVGVVSYSRKDLLKAKAAGTRLCINVVGMCHFANDIDVSLADETIESFKIVGKVTASSEVREVLKHKEAQE